MYFNDACEPLRARKRFLIQMLLIVKLSVFLVLVFSLQVGATGFSQTVTLNLKNAPVKKVFKEIMRQTGVSIIYNEKNFEKLSPVNIHVRQSSIENVLKLCFRDQEYIYQINNNTVSIRPAPPVIVKANSVEEILEAPPVTGSIVNADGSPLSNVSVMIKGSTTGVTTDANGKFSINVPDENTVLVISYVGYQEQEIRVGKQSTIGITLTALDSKIEEVVVVGYGSQSKRTLATATSRVSAGEFKNAVITTVDQALQGRTTGVQVTETSGEPGAATVVRIRGNNSLSGNNEPLYVIDGFPMPPYREADASSFYGSYSQNGLYGINPNDIESMEVLKDASAAAIYGSRGANGVVLITTKSGKRGEGKIELTNRTTIGQIHSPIKMMDSRQYATALNEYYDLNYGPGQHPFPNMDTTFKTTDWADLISQNSFRQDISLSVSGGTAKSSYYISGNYLYDEGTIINSDNGRASIRANLNNEVNSWYTIRSQISLVRQKTNRAITGSRGWPFSGGLMDALKAPPTIDQYYYGPNSMGIPNFASWYFSNPYLENTLKTDVSKNDYSIINIENWFSLTKELKLVVSLGGNQNMTRRQVFFPVETGAGFDANGGRGSSTMANTYSYNVNAYLNYDKMLADDHKLNLTLGGEYNNQIVELLNTGSSGYDIPSFGIDNIGAARVASIGSYREDRKLQSAFFRGNYSYKGKYILNTSVRLDGASPFAQNKKYGLFPAVAVAWNLDEEDFMSNISFVTNTKVRLSYGETGSQAINPYSSLPRYSAQFYELGSPSTIGSVLFPTALANPNLGWERTSQFNAGLDFNLFNSRLVVSIDYYDKRTTDLLQPRTLPSQAGFTTITDNYGAIGNKGVELSLSADLIRSEDLRWNARLNLSHNKTKLLNLGTKTTPEYVSQGGNLAGVTNILIPGQEIGLFYGYTVEGLVQASDFKQDGTPDFPYIGTAGEQAPGVWKLLDYNNDGLINTDDRHVLGKTQPDFVFGFNNDFTWKKFGVNVFFTGSVGNDLLNITRAYLQNGYINYYGVVFNQTQDWFNNRWTTNNQHNDPRYPGAQRNVQPEDAKSIWIEDGSFLRLKQLTLSYNFDKLSVLKNPRIFVTGTNLLTFTKYTGYDPEVSSYAQSLLQQGIDYGAYPAQRSYTLGFSFNF